MVARRPPAGPRARRWPWRPLVAALALVVAVALLARVALGGDDVQPPPPAPLAQVRALMGSPRVGEGVRVDLQLTQSVVPAAFLGRQALPAGEIRGRLWVAPGGDWRLELQGLGHDWQLTREGGELGLYGSASQTRYTLPAALLPAGITAVGPTTVSGPEPRVVAGRQAYRVRFTPRGRDLLLDRIETTADAQTGVPLEVAVYARGRGGTVLRMWARGFHRERVDGDRVRVRPPREGRTVPLGTLLDVAQGAGAIRVRGSGWERTVRIAQLPGAAGDVVRGLGGAAVPAGGDLLSLPLVSVVPSGRGALVGLVTPDRLRREARGG